jgi:membrane peptidoglycan carboxypeptidase
MDKMRKRLSGRTGGTGRKSRNTFTTKSGQTIKINRSLTDKIRARKDAVARARAQRLAGMPKGRLKRILYRLHPKRLYHYWFSREGGIMALKLTGIGLIAGFLLLVGLFAYFRKDLPNLRDISGNNIGGSIRYYDRTGQTLLWEDFDAVKRIPVKDGELSGHIKNATIAIEDKDFFRHGGFDPKGIARAGWNNIFGNGSTQGASTLSQQLVRLTQSGVNEDRTYALKIKELILAVELERSYSKQEILTGYLNTAPYGNVQYGVESAARDYFQKSAKELTLDEAAFLASIPQAPSYYSPYGPNFNPEALAGRQQYILKLMEQQKMITTAQRQEALKVNTLAKVQEPKQKFAGINAPYFTLAAKEFLNEKFGDQTVQRGGWKVTTTVDLGLQRLAEEQVSKGIAQVRRQKGDVAAFAAEDVKTGQIVALVGGPDFGNEEYGQNNYARYRLPPGSSFKPYDYAALIEKTDNNGAGSVLYDTQGPLPGYPCTNKTRPPPKGQGNCLWDYDFRYPGPMTIRYALGGSRNIPAVKAMLTVGVEETIEVANSLGLRSGYKCFEDEGLKNEGPCYASSAIGDGAYLKLDEHAHALGSLSRNGRNIPQTYILKIEDANGKVVDEWKPEKGEQVIREDTAYIINDILSDPNASYFPAGRKPQTFNGSKGRWKFAMKTGTTNDAKDGWMVGYSAKYSAAVWVGYHNRNVEMTGTMEAMTQPIWQGWMQGAHRDLQPEDWSKPAGVQTLPAYVVRNNPGLGAVVPSPSTDIFPSWYKKREINNQAREVDKVSKKLATECTPPRAKQTVTGGDASSFSGDRFAGGGATGDINTEQRDDIHKCEDAKPSITLTVNKRNDTQFDLVATVNQGSHALSSGEFPGTITFNVGGQEVNSQQIGGPGTYIYTYTDSGAGNKQVTATIIDSVLYESTDTKTYTVQGAQTNGPPGNNDDDDD